MFDAIAQEIERGQIDKGLWAEAFAAADGNENVAKARYIQFRVRQLTRQAHRPLRAYDFGTALLWSFAVGFCGLAASSYLGAIIWIAKERYELFWVMAAFGAGLTWASRALYRKVVARLTVHQPAHYKILEFVVIASLAFTLAAYMNSKAPDPLATALAGAAMAFIPYGFMAYARTKELTQTAAPEPSAA